MRIPFQSFVDMDFESFFPLQATRGLDKTSRCPSSIDTWSLGHLIIVSELYIFQYYSRAWVLRTTIKFQGNLCSWCSMDVLVCRITNLNTRNLLKKKLYVNFPFDSSIMVCKLQLKKEKIKEKYWTDYEVKTLKMFWGSNLGLKLMQSKIWVCDDNGPNYIVGMSSFKG